MARENYQTHAHGHCADGVAGAYFKRPRDAKYTGKTSSGAWRKYLRARAFPLHGQEGGEVPGVLPDRDRDIGKLRPQTALKSE